MRIRLTSLVLVLLLSGSALAGVPMQFGEESCGMDHVEGDMACCKAALFQAGNAEAATARLCCALHCSKEGTAPAKADRFSPQLQLTAVSYPPVPQVLQTSRFKDRLFGTAHGPPGDSHPAYIRNLALLI
jgi:hypothetical protein